MNRFFCCRFVFANIYSESIVFFRKALCELTSTVNANGMVRTQKEWGGSHDVILGHMIWLHDMPVYPISSAYRSDRMRKGSLDKVDNHYAEILENVILIHDVSFCVYVSVFLHIDF